MTLTSTLLKSSREREIRSHLSRSTGGAGNARLFGIGMIDLLTELTRRRLSLDQWEEFCTSTLTILRHACVSRELLVKRARSFLLTSTTFTMACLNCFR